MKQERANFFAMVSVVFAIRLWSSYLTTRRRTDWPFALSKLILLMRSIANMVLSRWIFQRSISSTEQRSACVALLFCARYLRVTHLQASWQSVFSFRNSVVIASKGYTDFLCEGKLIECLQRQTLQPMEINVVFSLIEDLPANNCEMTCSTSLDPSEKPC